MQFSERNFSCLILSVLLVFLPAGCNKRAEVTPGPEMRAVWLHTGLFSPDEGRAAFQMDSLFTLYNQAGINNLFCYNALPGENSFKYDYINMLISEGKKKGIGIHPIFYPGYTVNLEKELVEHPSWLIRDMEGNYLPHFNLANPEVREYWVDRIKESFKYDIAGIHLDYIRFPTTQVYSYDSLTCETFKKIFTRSPLEIARDCGSMIWCEWIKWNSAQVTELVKGIGQAVKNAGKPMLLGADVFPDIETSDVLIGQDWGSWANEGLIDFICPMLYTNDTGLFRTYIRRAVDAANGNCKVYPGIGVHTSHNDITKELIVREVNITREEKTNGMAFFSGYSFSKAMIDTLTAEVFKAQGHSGTGAQRR